MKDGNRIPIKMRGFFLSATFKCNIFYVPRIAGVCQDINECSIFAAGQSHTFGDSCGGDATCQNTDGSYNCYCNEGFDGTGFKCEDINECLNRSVINNF